MAYTRRKERKEKRKGKKEKENDVTSAKMATLTKI